MSREHMNELDPAAPITEQASYWWVTLNNETATPDDHHAFAEWVTRGPERIEAYLQAARLTKALKSKNVHWPDTPVDILIREAKKALAEVVPFTRPTEAEAFLRVARKANNKRPMLQRPLLFALAAAMLAIFAGAWVLFGSPQRYQTALGEQRSVVLNDGSVITLNTSSKIEVNLEKDHRTIRLFAGEALFQVAHDRARPFDVIAGDTTVRAVGTQFNVYRKDTETTVTVVEGRVAVSSDPLPRQGEGADRVALSGRGPSPSMEKATDEVLNAGEQVVVTPHSRPRATLANLATATAWTQRRLVFEHRPLGEVAEEFNRYNRQSIQIESAELRSQEVTGVFQANDPDSFMAFISKIPGVKIDRTQSGNMVVVKR
jgi:transmembrane sensor